MKMKFISLKMSKYEQQAQNGHM